MIKKYYLKKIHRLKRWIRKQKLPIIGAILLLLLSGLVYSGYMNRRLTVDPATYSTLLNLIASVESNDNYNAYFGNARNNDIKFTEMTVDEVMQWQANFIAGGNPSSAVGRYQIISTTLSGLVRELGINTNEKFDQAMQDKMAIALLERRGGEDYINDDITPEEFAANLAKEWAALPKVIGSNPSSSYYDGDGLNKSRTKVHEVLNAIRPIDAL